MIYKIKSHIFLEYLDRLLAGEKDINAADDIEIEKLLKLAKLMITADFSVNDNIKRKLKKQSLAKVNKTSIFMISSNHNELSEEDLDYVAAGISGQAEDDICPYCGSRIKKSNGKCPFCNR